MTNNIECTECKDRGYTITHFACGTPWRVACFCLAGIKYKRETRIKITKWKYRPGFKTQYTTNNLKVAKMTFYHNPVIAGRTIDEWVLFARTDRCLDLMVPSDLRQIVSELKHYHDAVSKGLLVPKSVFDPVEQIPTYTSGGTSEVKL